MKTGKFWTEEKVPSWCPLFCWGLCVPSQSLCNNGPPEWINALESVRSPLHITLRAFLFPPKASQTCLNLNQDFVLLRLDETGKWAVLHQAINFPLCSNKAWWSRLLEVLTDGFSRVKIQIYLPTRIYRNSDAWCLNLELWSPFKAHIMQLIC